MRHAEARMVAPAGPVRVSRNGNARTLTVPAEIVAAAEVELGDLYMVEVIDGDLLYRRLDRHRPRGHLLGDGAQRTLVLPRGATMPVGPDSNPAPPLDWDF